jgi:uncharacterized iron-regulated membrane protein
MMRQQRQWRLAHRRPSTWIVSSRWYENTTRIVWLENQGQFRVGLGQRPGSHGEKPFALVDGHSYVITGEAWSEKDWRNGGPMAVLLKLHTDMFMGLPGSLFLAAVGLLFMAATVSGIVLYGPFMRKLSFGTVRKHRQTRVKWLDIHNLLGAVSLAWVLVVGATGIINTLDTLVFRAWQHRISSQLNIDRSSHPPTGQPSSLQRAVTVARKALPDSEVSFVAFPGSMFGGPRHYAVYMRGQTPLTQHLLHPVLVDAANGALIDAGSPPWYLWALEGSRPLHFGDYAGLPLKLIWAGLDIILIIVLISGLYLWIKRGKAHRPRSG